MIYLEIVTSILVIFLIIYLSNISTVINILDENKSKELLDKYLKKSKDEKRYTKIKKILNNPTEFIASIKSAINFLNVWLSCMVIEIFATTIYKKLNILNVSSGYAVKYLLILITVVILTYFMYIFGELMPKIYAIKKKNKVSVQTLSDIYLLYYIFHPIAKMMNRLEKTLMKLMKVNRKDEIMYNDSEIKQAVEIGKEKGNLSKKDRDIISNFLKLDITTAKEIMKKIEDTDMIDISFSKEKIKEVILASGRSRIPVCDGDIRNIIGVINTKKLLQSMLKKERPNIKEIMKPCMYVPTGKRTDLLLSEMQTHKEHMAIVVEGKSAAVGIVTMEDIIEEMFGEIKDDFEKYEEK